MPRVLVHTKQSQVSRTMDRLPEEILDLIFTHLELTMDGRESSIVNAMKQGTLASLCRVNRAIYRIAHPILYRFLEVGHSGRRLIESMRPLLITLLRRPELARSVRGLHAIADDDNDRPDQWQQDTLQKRRDTQPLLAAVEELNLPELQADHLRTGLARGRQDAEVALLLGLCSEVESIGLIDLEDNTYPLVMYLLDMAARNAESARVLSPRSTSMHTFRRLRTAIVGDAEMTVSMDLTAFWSLSYLIT